MAEYSLDIEYNGWLLMADIVRNVSEEIAKGRRCGNIVERGYTVGRWDWEQA